jgi:hypothetical protein
MGKLVKRFEEFAVWQDGMTLIEEIYAATWDGPFSKDFALKDQIHKSARSRSRRILRRDTNGIPDPSFVGS